MVKQWSRNEVAIAHMYQNVERASHLDSFVNFCKKYDNPKILDLGCGNGRVCISLNDVIKKYSYLGLDINELALKSGNEYFYGENNIKLQLFDVDDVPWKDIGKFDICLIDSTLHMFDKPKEVLDECLKICDTIFITRNKIELDNDESITIADSEQVRRFIYTKLSVCTSFTWGGMERDSVYWKFSRKFFESFGTKIVYNKGPTPETFEIIMEKK
jgi:SAM-dependent methyltransferase